MRPSLPRLLITDLDNTLYDWVAYFATSFYAMVDELLRSLPIDRERLLDDFKSVHRKYHNSEHPSAVLEVDCIRNYFGQTEAILNAVNPALQAFNLARKQSLRLYDGVSETLKELQLQGVILIGHTEAIAPNAYTRLEMLGIHSYMSRLYALESPSMPKAPPGFIMSIPYAARKPNPELLAAICQNERVHPADTWYVGDSLTHDMSMAKSAAIKAIWARYGTRIDRTQWAKLVRITHWSDDDVRYEAELKNALSNVRPDRIIDRFDALLTLEEPQP